MVDLQRFINKVTCGDCLELMKSIPDKSIDLVLTDPPYGVLKKHQEWDNIQVDKFTNRWWQLLKNKLKEDSSAYIFWSQKYIPLGFSIFKPKRMLIWHHANLAKPTKRMFLWTYDPIFYVKFGNPVFQPSFVAKQNVDVFTYPKPQSNWKGDNHRFHPASKPLRLIKNFITISSKENDIVFDPFAGCGTTGVAAISLGRRFIGMEISSEYTKRANTRIAREMQQMKLELKGL